MSPAETPEPTGPILRAFPEDFVVDEIPAYAPSGEGDHTFVQIEKTNHSTEFVARALARMAEVEADAVGYAGRKDRRAVTTQWFSVPGLDPDAALAIEFDGVCVLAAERHPHKLRTGHLRGNRFQIVMREVRAEAVALGLERATAIRAIGFPNRFGPQRFGRDGDNAERARALLRGELRRVARRDARFLLSALQAEGFDRVLAARPLPLDRVEQGDVAFIHKSGGRFVVEDEERENERAGRFEISATAPLFGTRVLESQGAPAQREARALEGLGLPDLSQLRLPRGLRLRGTRRPIRVPVPDLSLEAGNPGQLRLACTLPAGSYVTVLIDELFAP